MVTVRNSARLLFGFAILFLVGGLAGCAVTGPCDDNVMCGNDCTLPTNLPADPEPCTKYCPVWVPPTYRPKPRVVQTEPGYTQMVPGRKLRTNYQEVCVKGRESYRICEPDSKCEQAVVQVTPGGYKWKDAGDGCYRYCYEPPVYQWCNKVVTEEGIDYCTESPPEYEMRVTHECVPTCGQQYVPAKYGICWEKEVFLPGHWEWQPVKECTGCECPQVPTPCIPFRPQPCRTGVVQGCPTTN